MLRTLLTISLLTASFVTVEAQDQAGTSASSVLAENHESFDWSSWKKIPTLHQGRIKPLDTLADEIVTIVTGRSKWTDPETEIKYQASELVFSWIAVREEWLKKPVIRCEFRPLRELLNSEEHPIKREGNYIAVSDVMDVDLFLKTGERKFHSQETLKEIEKILGILSQDKDPQHVGETSAERALNKNLAAFLRHFQLFLSVTEGKNIYVVPGLDPRTLAKQFDTESQISSWIPLSDILKIDTELKRIKQKDFTLIQSDREPSGTALAVDTPNDMFVALKGINYPTGQIHQFAQVIPLRAPIVEAMKTVKSNFESAEIAYRQNKASDFSGSMQSFARNLRELADKIQDVRPKLTPPERNSIDFGKDLEEIWSDQFYEPVELDERVIAASAYPAPDAVDLEITYNKYQPFRSAWIFFLIATIIISISGMVKTERTVFFLGLIVSLSGIVYSTWGFALRGLIAGRPPVTNMYETVIWVSFVVAVLGTWFCILPFIWPGLSWAWRLTGLPVRLKRDENGKPAGIEADTLAQDEQSNFLASVKTPIQIVSSIIRVAAAVLMIWVLTSSQTSFRIIDPLPVLSGKSFSIGSLITWCLGMGTSLLAAWYLPRTILTLFGSLLTIIPEGKRNKKDLWTNTIGRKYFLLGALPVACLGMMLAHFVGVSSPDILNPRIGSIAAVLRNNYWLTIHVLTIVSSYGAGALAWGLGNIAMFYYFLGKYQKGRSLSAAVTDTPQDGISERLRKAGKALSPKEIGETLRSGFKNISAGDEHLSHSKVRPPHEVNTLASYAYKSMQVAVLLLAAGTILGGLWADVSWGRFWDWDPKEVWALISLLVYLVVLHGRFAGWTGTFGTNAGAVLCFAAIMMSWYGVNFVLPQVHGWLNGTNQPTEVGLHSYATGAGGLDKVLYCVGLNILLVMAAWSRFYVETIKSDDDSDKPESVEKKVEDEKNKEE